MNLVSRGAFLALILLLVTACASAPQRNDQLDQAKAAVQALQSDPLAAQAASAELATARQELSAAESALEQRKDAEIVAHHAYLAMRRAEIGKARVAERRAREEIANGEAERNRVLLEARTTEAERAAAQAQAARSDAERQQTAAETAQAEAEAIRQQLAELKAQQTERGMVLSLGDVLFDTDRSTLKAGAELTIDRLSTFLKRYPRTRTRIEGHTDSTGSDAYNVELSQRRADSVANALRARGVGNEQMAVTGRGERFPVATNATAAGRQQNRRVEIVFSDAQGEFAQRVWP